VVTPEQFLPVSGTTTFDQSVAAGVANLDNCIRGSSCTTNPANAAISPNYVVYGYSQSTTIAMIEKQNLAATDPNAPVSFIMVADANRPNGGILARSPFGDLTIPLLGVTFNGPAATDTNFTTLDVARQYDIIADGPAYPLNLPALVNGILGYVYLHGDYIDVGTPILQDKYGDTTYYMIGTQTLPLLMPLGQLGIPHPILAVLDAPLRVFIEQLGYARTVSPGKPTAYGLIPFVNPINLAVSLLVSIPTGLDDGAQEAFGVRPFGTTPAGPYGVGGPPVTLPQQTTPGAPTPASIGATASTAATTPDTTAAAPDPTVTTATTPDPTASALATNDPAPLSSSLQASTTQSGQQGQTAESTITPDVSETTPDTQPKTKPARPEIRNPITNVMDSVRGTLTPLTKPSSTIGKGDGTAKGGSAAEGTRVAGGGPPSAGAPGSSGATGGGS
jgi:hypothetical protein